MEVARRFVGLRRDRVVAQSKIRRAGEKDYRGGYEAEGYAGNVGLTYAMSSAYF